MQTAGRPGIGDTGVARRGPGWRRRPSSGRGHYVPRAPSPCLPGPSHARRLRPRMLHFATSPCPCAFRAGTEHQVRGGDGREPDGPAPSSFQHQAGRKVNPTPPAPAKFEPGKPECALPIVSEGGFKFVPRSNGKRLQVQGPLPSLCPSLHVPLSSRAMSPRQGTLASTQASRLLEREGTGWICVVQTTSYTQESRCLKRAND